ncbi:hypothetical protein GN244_ATG11955 [Phytophthora infestans]|uniref:Uncharacterized protein n=1 Tax=Phytophthora infestans TaxID=4787 RepID=A0A833VZW4_PHYIN|nr:hypothetical protein GN244_ATG11955 [Phytophthora infestans]
MTPERSVPASTSHSKSPVPRQRILSLSNLMSFYVCFLEKIDVGATIKVQIPERSKPTRFCLCRRAKPIHVLRDASKHLIHVMQIRFCCGGARHRILLLVASAPAR